MKDMIPYVKIGKVFYPIITQFNSKHYLNCVIAKIEAKIKAEAAKE